MADINPTKLLLLVFTVLILEVIVLNGIIPSALFDSLYSPPPSWTSVGAWDVIGIASGIWYALNIAVWFLSKPFIIIAVAIQLLYFSPITLVTIVNSIFTLVLFICLVFIVRGSD